MLAWWLRSAGRLCAAQVLDGLVLVDLLATVRARVRPGRRYRSSPDGGSRAVEVEHPLSLSYLYLSYSYIPIPATTVQRSSVNILLPTVTVLVTVFTVPVRASASAKGDTPTGNCEHK